MTTNDPNRHLGRGPFRPEHPRSGDPYELSNGHSIECLPQGARNSRANLVGGIALATDPAVDAAGVDTGYATDEQTLRAPDLAVGQVPDTPGWVAGAPPLAVEYAVTGQDEADLNEADLELKIGELFGAGTRFVWVVRLVGLRRVEVHSPGWPLEVRVPGDLLEAPGVLQNPVPVEALFDPAAAQDAALRNLLQRQGYALPANWQRPTHSDSGRQAPAPQMHTDCPRVLSVPALGACSIRMRPQWCALAMTRPRWSPPEPPTPFRGGGVARHGPRLHPVLPDLGHSFPLCTDVFGRLARILLAPRCPPRPLQRPRFERVCTSVRNLG